MEIDFEEMTDSEISSLIEKCIEELVERGNPLYGDIK
jgi:hypothetical protein